MHFIPLVLCFLSALLPLCVFDVLFFHLFYYCLSLSLPSLTSSFSLPVRREKKIGDRVHELICLFIFIYWDINHWWSPIIPLLLSASVCVCVHVNKCGHSFSEEDGNELWKCFMLFSIDSHYSCCLCPPLLSVFTLTTNIRMYAPHSYEQHGRATLGTCYLLQKPINFCASIISGILVGQRSDMSAMCQ